MVNKLLLLGLINFSVLNTTPFLDISADTLSYRGGYGGPSDPSLRIAYIVIETEFTLSPSEKATIKSDLGNHTLAFKISSESGYRNANNVVGEITERNKHGVGDPSGYFTRFTNSDYLFSESIYYDTNTTFNNLFENSILGAESTFYFKLYFELGNVPLDTLMLYALNKDGTIQITSGNYISTSSEFWAGYDIGYEEGLKDGKDISRNDYGIYIDGVWRPADWYGNYMYNQGLNETDATGFVGLLSAVFGGLGDLMAIEILPGIYIGAIIAIPLVFGIIFFILGKRKGD